MKRRIAVAAAAVLATLYGHAMLQRATLATLQDPALKAVEAGAAPV